MVDLRDFPRSEWVGNIMTPVTSKFLGPFWLSSLQLLVGTRDLGNSCRWHGSWRWNPDDGQVEIGGCTSRDDPVISIGFLEYIFGIDFHR